MRNNNINLNGIYRDHLISFGKVKFDSGWRSNIIVNNCRDLLAAFMKGDGAIGIQYIAIGKGDANWDVTQPAPPVAATNQLEDLSQFELDVGSPQVTLDYLNDANGVVVNPTNRIQITVSLTAGSPAIDPGDDTYPLREFGLFGRIGTDDYMIDYVRHPVIHKGPDDTLVRTVRLVF